jgi:hypothetical protein
MQEDLMGEPKAADFKRRAIFVQSALGVSDGSQEGES